MTAPAKIEIAKELREGCPVPDPDKIRTVSELALRLEAARLCERSKRQAILSIIDSLKMVK